ncbi:cell division protein FtsA [Spirochaeta africana]|uniref:Cell division protein FtsA n=1 Tax=Spirochaeta africana (strain ATCC 700263 / DSM 8902 / Z-7692) TaxID=889378 RepID=H9UKX2_SPIAZ|nr:cell division protein FtsA [Spirochaeta africana]AFG38165.1 cell division protein FtsA [Spirochaeta africana DSM 8902]
MTYDDVIVGLDIGTTSVIAVVAEFDDSGNLEIIGIGKAPSHGLRKGVVINIESTLQSVSLAIERAEQMAGRDVFSVITGIAGGHIEGINSRGVVAVTSRDREIKKVDYDRVLEAAKAVVIPMDRELLHVIPQEFIVDDQGGIKDPLDMIGVRLEAEVHIITGSVTSAQNLVKCINRAGFKVEDIILESLASGKAVLTKDEMELGVLVIDLGGGTTDALLYIDGAPYFTSVLPVGGSQVTGDLSYMLKTPIEAAEKIKIESAVCHDSMVDADEPVIIPAVGGRPPVSISQMDICSIVQPRMAEIFTLVRDRVVAKGYRDRFAGGVVLTGGGALMPGAVELAQEVFQTAARIGLPGSYGGITDEYRSPEFASAVGLVLHGASRVIAGESAVGVKETRTSPFSRLGAWVRNFFE